MNSISVCKAVGAFDPKYQYYYRHVNNAAANQKIDRLIEAEI
jgi:hypothetical protein